MRVVATPMANEKMACRTPNMAYKPSSARGVGLVRESVQERVGERGGERDAQKPIDSSNALRASGRGVSS